MMLIDENEAEIEKSNKIIALFYADWCRYCRQFRPLFESLASTSEQRFTVVDISDEESELWDEYEIAVVPTLIAFSGGEIIARRDGKAQVGLSESNLRELVEEIQD
ncbi:MAG: thioredoxin family protein [Thermoplasmata archaeon]